MLVSVRAWSGHHETPVAPGVPFPVGPLKNMTELFGASKSWLSTAYKCQQTSSCFKLLRQFNARALSLALLKAGKSIAARMAMMAMTTSSSIKVNPEPGRGVRARAAVKESLIPAEFTTFQFTCEFLDDLTLPQPRIFASRMWPHAASVRNDVLSN